jgi:hypothetical protein
VTSAFPLSVFTPLKWRHIPSHDVIVVFLWIGPRYYLQTGMFVNLTLASSIFIVTLIKSTKLDVSCS